MNRCKRLRPAKPTISATLREESSHDEGAFNARAFSADAMQTPPGTPVRIEQWGGPGVLAGSVRRVEPSAITKVSALGAADPVFGKRDSRDPNDQSGS